MTSGEGKDSRSPASDDRADVLWGDGSGERPYPYFRSFRSGHGLHLRYPRGDTVPELLPVGLFLLTVFGLVPLLLAYGAFTGKVLVFQRINEMSGYHWSWTGGALLVLALVIWLAVEGMLIGLDYAATYMTVALGSLVLIALVLPSTRRFYRRK